MMELFKKPGENDRQFIFRIGRAKESGAIDLSWQEITDIFNRELTELKGPEDRLSASTYQQQYRIAVLYYEDVFKDQCMTDEMQEQLALINDRTQEMYKEKIKMQDVAREYKKHLRDDARIEVLMEAIKEDNCRFKPTIQPYIREENNGGEAILCIGDWHIGANVSNFYNVFNVPVAEQRVQQLCNKVIKYCNRNKIKTLHVLNLGDLLEGEIHATSRIESELDVIEQIKIASRLLCQLLVSLSGNVEQVIYRSVVDNHSRVQPNYKDHIEKESFCKLIDWWLSDKIDNMNKEFKEKGMLNHIEMKQDNLDDNIGYLKIGNKNIFFQHGHQGSQNSVIQDLSFATDIVADIVIMGHWHQDKVKNCQGKKVYFNGSLKGVDSYTLNKRLFSQPTQSLLIFDEDDVIDIPMLLQ